MTTDERLAALEAKLDALTAPPSDYYTSRYSGEEIDAAIAAVPGKAETAQLCNRNLLDNWYFGNPVDQRGGHIVPSGTQYFVAGASTPSGTLSVPTKVTGYLTTGGITHPQIVVDNTTYITPSGSDVRGYVGREYGLDRWRVSANGIITVTGAGVLLQKTANSAYGSMYEVLDATPLLGKEITIAALINDNLYAVSGTVPDTVPTKNTAVCISARIDDVTIQSYLYTTGVLTCEVVNYGTGACKAGAAKLELGDTQTLAHQDASGNWVLNEIPDYGEQMRRCQRYYYQISYVQYQTINMAYEDTAYAFILLPLPVEMRLKNPVLTQSAPIALGSSEKTLVSAEATGCMARLGINYSAIANAVKSCYSYCPSAEGVTFSLSADL